MTNTNESKWREFWLQWSSFIFCVVDSGESNPDWNHKPFKVVEIGALRSFENQVEIQNELLVEQKTEIDKIEFIKTIPGYEKINAYLDLHSISCIKDKMCKAGLYSNPSTHVNDSAVMNLLLKAQGKTVTIRNVGKKRRSRL